MFSGHPGKDYPADRLPNKDAQERLVELGYDDRDLISRLRVGGTPRLYWWDPEHKVWPSPLRNT